MRTVAVLFAKSSANDPSKNEIFLKNKKNYGRNILDIGSNIGMTNGMEIAAT